MNTLLELTLRILYRLSYSKETEEEYFPLDFYTELVYKHFIFDLPKLFDISAIFGESNPQVVKTLVSNVFENDKRYI